MKKFLEYVADDILLKYSKELDETVIVFPNKRASLFLNKYLMDRIGHPFWSPRYITISELFREQSELTVADPIKATCMMHRAFTECTGSAETLEEFWNWGQLILADFDDLDKNMAEASQVFTNISNIHAMDNIDFLDETQKELIKKFFKQFSDDPDSRLKQRFLHLWNKLYDIYTLLNEQMQAEGLAYEGALYREVAKRTDTLEWEHKHYLFVGFNLAQESEQRLFKSMREQGLAHFYWDFDRYYLDNPSQEAGMFISEYLVKFPNELDIKDADIYENFNKDKDVTYLSASTENIQARYVTDWLRQNNRLEDGERTAIVLADEQLLKSVIHYLPEELSGKANITIGYPLAQSPVASLVTDFIMLHTTGYKAQMQAYLLKPVLTMLRHPYFAHLSPRTDELINKLHNEHIHFPSEQDLCMDEDLSMVFRPIDVATSEMNAVILERLALIIRRIGQNSEAARLEELAYQGINPEDVALTHDEQFMQESIFQMSKVIARIGDLINDGTLQVAPHMLMNLLHQIIQTTSMPFHGEPAIGVQIMGVLETRNLDFDHVLILSCNEGNLPKGISESSLIPYSIRKAHKLTTVDRKVAIYAYYFYRLLQRCGDVSMTYNCATDDGQTGQMSRFMLQLMVEDTHMNLSLNSLTAQQTPRKTSLSSIEKDETIMQRLDNMNYLSPSSLNKYLRCPLQFYFHKIVGLNEPDCDDISDIRTFGTVFHKTMELVLQKIMSPDGIITAEVINILLKEKNNTTIKRCIDEAFHEEVFHKKKVHYDGLGIINSEIIKRLVINVLASDANVAPLQILSLEKDEYSYLTITTRNGERKIKIGGYIDRLDRIKDANGQNIIRVIDYKTGSPKNANFTIEDLFIKDNIGKHSDYYIQAMTYAYIVRHKYNEPTQPALFFVRNRKSLEAPVLCIGPKNDSQPISDIINFENDFIVGLRNTISEIFNPSIPFHPTVNERNCSNCAFFNLCHT